MKKQIFWILLLVISSSVFAQTRTTVQKAAEQGDAQAQYNLGLMYDEGEGVRKDYGKAVYWYEKAAEQGDASAQSNLGLTGRQIDQ